MAARILKPRHQDDIRQKIQTSQLVNRLTNHALGKVKMSATQVQAIRILLGKTLPDLTATTLSGDPNNPLAITEIRRTVVYPKG